MSEEQEKSLSKVYDPKMVEDRWYHYWSDHGYFHAEPDEREPYCIVIPPPNVTGSLHLGHAWDETEQDILIRWRRMQGYNALWIPGTDHAGIATQIKVEGELAKEGLTRYDLGREKFLERVWNWKEKYGGRIIEQLKRVGASCDWDRLRFTMDEGCSRAVKEIFVRLYEKGLIYQGDRITNWCPRCHTALSDIEVEHEDVAAHLYYLSYPLEDGSGTVTVATTRPETMLGDTAVAVHPDDERYRGMVGKYIILPLMNRRIPIVADAYVDPKFGTGAVKITPAHDPNDYELGQRHDLPNLTVIDEDGKMTKEAGAYAGMERFACRKKVLEDMEAQGRLVKVEDLNHAVGHCSRCNTVVEPLLSKQWYVKMEPLARPAIAAVKEGRIQFVPDRFAKLYLNWVENVHDWCISRQLWWGHRIPVWYCQDCGEIIAAVEEPEKCPQCGSAKLEQDPDVLDTWFSSALWPFSTLGWPDKTEDLAYYYPTATLVTGFDIIYFWVARMIFMGLEFQGEIPFHTVCIHGLIRDAEGKKMSKSRGNGIDPIDVIEQYGADALRFSLITGVAPGYDMRFYTEKVEASRNFANKVWNASRFAMMHLEDFAPQGEPTPADLSGLPLSLADRWILSRYRGTAQEVTRQLEKFDFGEAARVLYDFLWSEFCDWYIEAVKPRLYGKDGAESRRTAQTVLWYVLEHTLRLLHPFMPFLTEEIWQHLPHQGDSIMLAPWPAGTQGLQDLENAPAEADMSWLIETIRAIRNLRTEAGVPPAKEVKAVFRAGSEAEAILQREEAMVKTLAGAGEVVYLSASEEKPAKSMTAVVPGIEVYLPLEGIIDLQKEVERLAKEVGNLEVEMGKLKTKLANQSFVLKAPPEVVEKERQRFQEMAETYGRVKARWEELSRS